MHKMPCGKYENNNNKIINIIKNKTNDKCVATDIESVGEGKKNN